MSNWSNAYLWVTDWILCSFWSADDSVNILDSSGQESTECSLKLVGSSSCETSKMWLIQGQIVSFGVTRVIVRVIRDQISNKPVIKTTNTMKHTSNWSIQSNDSDLKMLHEKCCTKNVARKMLRLNVSEIILLQARMKTYSFALACCFWVLFDLDWSWWHCSGWCCSCSCSCFSFCCRCWFSCCSCPGSWSSSRLRCSCWSLSCRGCWSGSLSSSLSSSRSGSKTCCQYRLRRRNNHINFILERQTSKHCK